MSHEGKMRRGEQFLNKSFIPEAIKADVEYFLENSKPKEEKKEKVVKKVKKEIKEDDN